MDNPFVTTSMTVEAARCPCNDTKPVGGSIILFVIVVAVIFIGILWRISR